MKPTPRAVSASQICGHLAVGRLLFHAATWTWSRGIEVARTLILTAAAGSKDQTKSLQLSESSPTACDNKKIILPLLLLLLLHDRQLPCWTVDCPSLHPRSAADAAQSSSLCATPAILSTALFITDGHLCCAHCSQRQRRPAPPTCHAPSPCLPAAPNVESRLHARHSHAP